MSLQANKRILSSTTSEGETSAVDTSVFEENKISNKSEKSTTDAKDSKQKKKTQSKKQKTMDQFMETSTQHFEKSPMEKKLEEIDKNSPKCYPKTISLLFVK